VQVGTVGPGLTIILTGRVDITQQDESGHRRHIVTHGPGSFIYPTGISGMALMAHAYNQAQKFGVEMGIPDEVTGLDRLDGAESGPFVLKLSNSEQAKARSSVIATGARYRRLAVDGLEAFEGSSVHYWASPLEAKLCSGQEVALVGGGNSAGQAAVYLASHVAKVWLLVRGQNLRRACRAT